MTKLECIRCGICCSTGPCPHGVESNEGVCIYLILHRNGGTSCILVLEGIVRPKDVGIGSGCTLRRLPKIYNIYKKTIGERFKILKQTYQVNLGNQKGGN